MGWRDFGNLLQERAFAGAVNINPETFWILGFYYIISYTYFFVNYACNKNRGGSYNHSTDLTSSEIYKNGGFHPGPDFIYPVRGHCMVKLNGTHFGVLGGTTGKKGPMSEPLKSFHIYNTGREECLTMPNMTSGIFVCKL